MKLLRPRTFIIFALAGLSGAVLLHTSQNVQLAEERLESLEHSLAREREKTRMLRAEWEALNRPERLERLADEFLDLLPPAPGQMALGDKGLLPEPAPVDDEGGEGYEPVLQPVTFETAKPPAPKPAHKPLATPRPPAAPASEEKATPPQEKAFGDLLNELGGGG